MGLNGVIYEQAPRPNPMGAALQQAGTAISEGYRQGRELQRQKDQQLVALTMQFLPRFADNPQMLQTFTNHPDFGNIMGAFSRVGMGNVFMRDPGTGSYKISIPPEQKSLEQLYAQAVQSGDKDLQAKYLEGLSAKGLGSYYAKRDYAEALSQDDPNKMLADQKLAMKMGRLPEASYNERPVGPQPGTLARLFGAKGKKQSHVDKIEEHYGDVRDFELARGKRKLAKERAQIKATQDALKRGQ